MSSEFFKEINLKTLSKYAGEWAKSYRSLVKVLIFRRRAENAGSGENANRFVIAAIFDQWDHEVDFTTIQAIENGNFSFEEVQCIFFDEPTRFLNWAWGDCRHIWSNLADSYKWGAPVGFEKNWLWFSIPSGDQLALNDFVVLEDYNNSKATLFPNNESEAPEESGAAREGLTEREKTTLNLNFPPEIRANYAPEELALIQEAMPEIETLWGAMKSIHKTLIPDEDSDIRETYKKAALRSFEQFGKGWLQLTKEIVSDESLYYIGNPLTPLDISHHKRDFVGKLYQLLINKRFPQKMAEPTNPRKDYGAKKLYDIHKEMFKKSAPTPPQH